MKFSHCLSTLVETSNLILQVVQVLSKHAGLWVTKKKEIMYSQVKKHHLRPNIKAHSVNLQDGLS